MPLAMPAASLVAVPGRRHATLEAARELDRRGFSGLYCPSIFGNLSLCQALAHVTERCVIASSITPLYSRTVLDFAQSAAFLHEVSHRRFRLGIGVSHAPAHQRMGVSVGKPLADVTDFVARYRAQEGLGELPPIFIATLRRRMIALAGEIADGMVFANAARSHMAVSLAALPVARRDDPGFLIANMIPTCISDDVEAAKAVNRRTLTSYAMLPNYRNYWKEAGYEEEMTAIETALEQGRKEDVGRYLGDRWLADCTLFGTPAMVREGLEAWYAAGVRTPIVVPSSASGNQMKGIEELLATFTG